MRGQSSRRVNSLPDVAARSEDELSQKNLVKSQCQNFWEPILGAQCASCHIEPIYRIGLHQDGCCRL